MSGPTPGPWTVEEYGDEDCPELVIHSDSENCICFMATPGSHGYPANIAANARLIAASPDLLIALNGIIKRYAELVDSGDCGFWEVEGETEMITARAALAKATGAA